MASGGCGGEVGVKEKVRELMEELISLQIKRDEEGRENAELASRIQCDIFRKYMIVDAMIGEGPATGVVTAEWRQKLEEISKVLEQTKVLRFGGMGAERPSRPGQTNGGVEDQDESSFLVEFPNEVWEVIFGKISSASDKLNVIKALPFAAELMNWRELNLHFELIFPVLMKLKKLEAKDVINLCGVNDSFRASIMTWFESELKKEEPCYHPVPLADVFQFLQDSNIQLDTIPFLVEVRSGSLSSDCTLSHFETLNKIGSRIRDCMAYPNVENEPDMVPAVEQMQILRGFLLLMPNLQSLRLNFWNQSVSIEEDFSTEELQQIDDIELPDLPKLKYLKFCDGNCQSGPLREALMRKYHSGLVGTWIPVTMLISSDAVWIPWKMTELEFVRRRLNLRNCFQSFESQVDAALKIVTVYGYGGSFGHEDIFDPETFPNLMKFLSQFGETLEDVCVHIGASRIYEYSAHLWFIDLNFPKVKSIFLGSDPGTWNFLLQLPALEKLIIDNRECRECGPKRILDISGGKDSVRNSNIWKILPFLDVIECRYFYDPNFEVSRKDCMKYQLGIK